MHFIFLKEKKIFRPYLRIVEERADATNVNNWHWTEKNATGWSKDKLKELLVGLQVENDECIFNI